MSLRIRQAEISDLLFLQFLERTVFSADRRESPDSLRRSVCSPHQEVWLMLDGDHSPIAAMTVRFRERSGRIYSLGVLPEAQGKGAGRELLGWAESRAQERGCRQVTLEMDLANEGLARLYRSQGYSDQKCLPDYYGENQPGLRMAKVLENSKQSV